MKYQVKNNFIMHNPPILIEKNDIIDVTKSGNSYIIKGFIDDTEIIGSIPKENVLLLKEV